MAYNHRETIEREAGYPRSSNRLIRWEDIHNPIPDSLSEADYANIFDGGNGKPFFVPYAGWGANSVHSYLELLILLSQLSATHGSCIESQGFVCLGGPLDIVGDRQRYAFQEARELSEQDKLSYLDTVSRYIPGFDAKAIMDKAFHWGKKTGDRWYLIEGNKDYAQIEVLDPRRCMYYYDKNVEYKVVGVGAGRMNSTTIEKKDYILVPEYPQVGEYNGGWRTIVHFKDGQNTWYGRPDSVQSLITMFREYKDDEYLLKASANHFTGRAFLEFEDDPIVDDDTNDDNSRNDGYSDFSAQVDANMTNKAADPMGFMMMTRPYGSSASVLHQMSSNTPEGFFSFLKDTSIEKITMAHKWSQKLLGIESASGFSTNEFWDIFNIKRIGVIKKYQDMLSSELKQCLDVVGEMYGFENDARFISTTPFDQLNEELKATPQPQETPEEDEPNI